MKTIILTKGNPSITLPLSPEIENIFIRNIKSFNIEKASEFNIEYILTNNSEDKTEETINLENSLYSNSNSIRAIDEQNGLTKGLESPFLSITIQTKNNLKDSEKIEVVLYFKEYISVEEPFKRFQEHLNEKDNSKILFSAPFGQGKTTFLQLFFEQETEEYNVFHLFPINYSIADNKDILEYIKCAILLSLVERNDIEFDKEKFNYLETLPQFALNNADKLLAPFLRLIPAVGGDLFAIYDNLKNLSESYFKEHDEQQIDDEKKALDYIQMFYEKEGSIYEDNFVTQLIRQLLEQLKSSTKKANVLIIDDLDRMDPEHIFRILNIFAAHFDNDDNIQITNKFGFDKIIIVCDYNNLKRIFAHKFGSDTDFAGYINKFFSKGIFKFNNIAAALESIDKSWNKDNEKTAALKAILIDLFISEKLSLREIFTINKLKYNNEIHLKSNKTDLEYISNFKFLTQIFNLEDLKARLLFCRENYNSTIFERRLDYDYLTRDAFIELYYTTNNEINFEYLGKKLKLIAVNGRGAKSWKMGYMSPHKLICYNQANEETEEKIEFTPKDFYTVLLEIINEYSYKITQKTKPINN